MIKKIKNRNSILHEPSVFREDREKLNDHKSCIFWFTGLSGSGKSTLAYALEDYLHKKRMRTLVLDGDNIRQGLCKDLGFSDDDRAENIRRIGEVSQLLLRAGVITLAAFISPFTKDRRMVRNRCGPGEFIEIFCNASLEICEKRDVKGLYKKARAGEIPEFTGISSIYEKPVSPEIILNTGIMTINECVEQIVAYLEEE